MMPHPHKLPRPMAASARLLLPVAGCLLALAACSPTEGDTGAFEPQITTNNDFTLPGNFPDISDITVPVGNSPITMAAADYDGDLDLDIAVVNRLDADNQISGSLSLLTNDGSANFNETVFTLGVNAGRVFFIDLGGGATPDLLVVINDPADPRLWFCVDPAPTPTCASEFTISLAGIPQQVEPVDLDGDGDLDVLFTIPSSDRLGVLLNPITGTSPVLTTGTDDPDDPVTCPVTMETGPGRFAAGDFDGNSNPDVAVLHSAIDTVSIWLGDGAGCFTEATTPTYTLTQQPLSIVTGDFIGDAGVDLAISNGIFSSTGNTGENLVSVFTGDGTGGFGDPPSDVAVGENPGRLLAADFDTTSARLEMFLLHRNKKLVTFISENATPPPDFATQAIATTRNPFDMAMGTFAATPGLDLAVVESQQRALSILDGNGAGTFIRTVVGFAHTVTFPLAVDLDGAGESDLLLLQPSEDRVVLLLNP